LLYSGRPDDTATEQQVIENVQVRVEEADHTDIGEPAHAGHREGVRGILTINLRVVVGLDTLRNAATKLDVRIVDELGSSSIALPGLLESVVYLAHGSLGRIDIGEGVRIRRVVIFGAGLELQPSEVEDGDRTTAPDVVARGLDRCGSQLPLQLETQEAERIIVRSCVALPRACGRSCRKLTP